MVAQLQQAQQLEIQQSYTRLAQALKDELLNHLTGTIDKVCGSGLFRLIYFDIFEHF
jgi:hypothetical protein